MVVVTAVEERQKTIMLLLKASFSGDDKNVQKGANKNNKKVVRMKMMVMKG